MSEDLDKVLQNTELNYQILDGIVDLVRVLDHRNEVVYVNQAMKDTLGYDTENLICNISDNILKSKITKRTLETGEVIQREETIQDKLYSVKCSPIKKDGKITGAVEVFRNISQERKLISAIVEKNKSMTVEMNHARKIQTALLPEKGFFGVLKIDYLYRPSNLLSGDMFDIFEIDDDHLGIYIADTVGHGFAASMVTMFIRITMRTISYGKKLRPSLLLQELWKRFKNLGLDFEIYFTCFYGVFNKKTGQFTYSNAGHFPCPIIIHEDTIQEMEVEGYPISRFFDKVEYKEYSIKLNTSDKVIMMSDGVSEVMNYENEPYGIDRVKEIMLENESDELLKLKQSIYSYMWGEQKDDITALLIKVW
ncbi:PAS domain S-box-containing protein [Peptoniphilus asaccharolyticus DSM 20463]|uniref:PAS domain S-box-containing protein n=1 Tax=Peptoniphilus asaccharolyticus DSM 20463 TaxID=573058 RepID=A0A1W1VIZ1_PEPAS|nr:PP2C family protein-serine/threonine phosphatase [Peptoniphilus asaccharolyticus]MBL7574374.1 SpoIIE family protein phosphatase [Peptoniphilus asaccharolyticus]SMB93296.1 PAS domain S-box-containing protein [Peptoniphilus asaccharolyticus DSM 20463]